MSDEAARAADGPGRIRVVVVDDQTLVRSGIRSLLDLAGIDVVGEASDGAEAIAVVGEVAPDVVLLDLRMPRFGGLWTLRELRERAIATPVLVLTTFNDDTLVFDALRAGARGYLLKDVTLEQLRDAVHRLAAGGSHIAPSITQRLLRAIETAPPLSDGPVVGDVQPLTERELEVLRLVAAGCSNREIADVLHLAEGTVKNHVSTMLVKLQARDRTSAVLRALHEGVLG